MKNFFLCFRCELLLQWIIYSNEHSSCFEILTEEKNSLNMHFCFCIWLKVHDNVFFSLFKRDVLCYCNLTMNTTITITVCENCGKKNWFPVFICTCNNFYTYLYILFVPFLEYSSFHRQRFPRYLRAHL